MEQSEESAYHGQPGSELVPVHDTVDGDDDEDHGGRHDMVHASQGRTLLPTPIASAVSFTTRSTSFAIRVGTLVGGYGFGAAKFTTLSSLELGRGILEGILSRAGKDLLARSRTELGRENAETTLERSLESLHQTMTNIVFWATTGFHITGTTVSTVSEISQLFLSVLDQFFGSTDSSKAIASIITLIRREFQNPATGVHGERVGVIDLILGLCGLAYLQTHCRKLIQEETRRLGYEEVIWDVVVLNDGERVDVHEDSLYGVHKGAYTTDGSAKTNNNDGIIEAIEQHGAQDSDSDDELPEIHLKRQIMNSLPKDASVSISTATTTTKTITVEIKGTPNVPLLTPPGADVIESEITPADQSSGIRDALPTYRVVYRVSRNKLRSTEMEHREEDDTRSRIMQIDDEDEDDDASSTASEIEPPPPVPPKLPRASTAPAPTRKPVVEVEPPPRNARAPSSAGSAGSNGLSSPKERTSHIPLPQSTPENTANQKKVRQPLGSKRTDEPPVNRVTSGKQGTKSHATKEREPAVTKPTEKKGGFRNALKKGSVPGLANLLSREPSTENVAGNQNAKQKPGIKPPWGSYKPPQNNKSIVTQTRTPIPDRSASMIPQRDAPRPPQRGNPNYFSSRDLGNLDDNRSQSRSSYVAVHERRRNSTVSQTDTYSIHSFESRPASPTYYRGEFRSPGMPKSKSGNDMADFAVSPQKTNNRARSRLGGLYTPSIYTLRTSGSQTSLVLASYHQKSAYSDSEAVDTLRKTGMVDGMFPSFHILRNITRYSRYASAAYGSNFLKFMGIAKEMAVLKALDDTHRDVRSFAQHTELPPDSILLSSFVDPQGGSDSTGSTDTGIPLVHTISLDEESKAVVLSCRGTLGFEDVLADMMCEYDDLLWRGQKYKVHKGIHASARRLLYGGDGRVLLTIKETLEEFPGYGLILCGHSLGGAVTALLGAMLAEPSPNGTAFVTSAHQHKRLLTDGQTATTDTGAICLPPGRPIHVYAYGPPATMSPGLQKATRGLITSTVHGNDLVPYLSLGVLHDFQAVALAFKSDNNDAKAEVRRRIWEGLQSGLASKWYNSTPKYSTDEEDKWAWAALKTLRASMMSPKLMPPGEVFVVESTPVLRRDAFVHAGEQIGRPATRIVLKYVRDVETRFREVRFGSSMLTDHSPGRYEDALRRLTLGVVDS